MFVFVFVFCTDWNCEEILMLPTTTFYKTFELGVMCYKMTHSFEILGIIGCSVLESINCLQYNYKCVNSCDMHSEVVKSKVYGAKVTFGQRVIHSV